MKQTTKTILISVGAALVVVATVWLALWWLLPMRGMFGGLRDDAGFEDFGPMGRGMISEMHGMVDVDSEYAYMSSMIPHHEEAVENARILHDRTNREEMREFAQSIIEVQTREIEQMEAWLARWYSDRPARADYDPMMRDYGGLHGDELDRAFLQDMIPHHMAAVMMSQEFLTRGLAEHDEVADLARDIRDAQLREIRLMSNWLRGY